MIFLKIKTCHSLVENMKLCSCFNVNINFGYFLQKNDVTWPKFYYLGHLNLENPPNIIQFWFYGILRLTAL